MTRQGGYPPCSLVAGSEAWWLLQRNTGAAGRDAEASRRPFQEQPMCQRSGSDTSPLSRRVWNAKPICPPRCVAGDTSRVGKVSSCGPHEGPDGGAGRSLDGLSAGMDGIRYTSCRLDNTPLM